jgi:hypothetical protein
MDEVGAAREVAPLVAAARLQDEALQDLVAELGVADAGVGIQARRHRVLLEHGAHAVVLADVAEEVDGAEALGPVEVVHQAHGARALGGEEAAHLRAQVADPLGHGLLGVEGALGRGSRIADQAGRAPDEPEWPVSGQLQTPHRQQLHEIAEVEARGGRVESAVVGDGLACEQLLQRGPVGGHVDEPAPDELLPDILEGVVVLLGCEDHGV